MTLGLLRLRFWIPQGRAVVKRWLHQCVTCTRWRAATPQPKMGNLPPGRVTPARPFLHVGIDYAGPIFIRTSKGRGHSAHKAFIAVFICFSSKAVHLEAVSAYTTDAFLAALRRFTSRRGLCTDIYSDCGTNFSGADRQLREMLRASSSREYLNTLATRPKWTKDALPPRLGSLCIIRSELSPPNKWPLARITQLHPQGRRRSASCHSQNRLIRINSSSSQISFIARRG